MKSIRSLHRWHRVATVAALLLAVAPCLKAQSTSGLVIHFADGTTQTVQLYTQPLVTFEEGFVKVVSPVATMSYEAKDVLRFTYEGYPMSDGVEAALAADTYRHEGEQLVFDARVQPSDIQLFSDDGKHIPASISVVGGRPVLSISSLPAGIYLLSVNGRTSKLLKR